MTDAIPESQICVPAIKNAAIPIPQTLHGMSASIMKTTQQIHTPMPLEERLTVLPSDLQSVHQIVDQVPVRRVPLYDPLSLFAIHQDRCMAGSIDLEQKPMWGTNVTM